MKRYFYFSATYAVSVRVSSESFGIGIDNFPTKDELHDVVRKYNPGAGSIVIMSISEMKKDELLGLLPKVTELP